MFPLIRCAGIRFLEALGFHFGWAGTQPFWLHPSGTMILANDVSSGRLAAMDVRPLLSGRDNGTSTASIPAEDEEAVSKRRIHEGRTIGFH